MTKMKMGYRARVNEDGTRTTADVNVRGNETTLKQGLIGSALIAAGVMFLTKSAFKNGATAHEIADMRALDEIGCLGHTPECTDNEFSVG